MLYKPGDVKKSIRIFLLAILLPSVVLGWLALRSTEERQIILERRTAELYQKETENAAAAVRTVIDDERRGFNEAVRSLLASQDPQALGRTFAGVLKKAWPREAIGFALDANGQMLSPTSKAASNNPAWQGFLLGNSSFLCANIPATVYWVSGDELNRPEPMRKSKAAYDPGAQSKSQVFVQQEVDSQQRAQMPKAATPAQKSEDKAAAAPAPPAPQPAPEAAVQQQSKLDEVSKEVAQQGDKQDFGMTMRNVAPQRMPDEPGRNAVSQLTPATADFRALTSDSFEGVITRYVQDKLDIIFWVRPAQAPEMIFGCLIEAGSLRDLWPRAFPETEDGSSRDLLYKASAPEFVLALLDDKARPVATKPAGATGREWKRPFVASEIGEALPHWEAALYLMRPQQLQESARTVRRTLLFLVVAAVAAIAFGGWIVVADARRQVALAQKKTDFVSNVSHELKTPLTSIRMFAELMQNGRPETAEKFPQYLRIIMVEAERLTRLINNVLDFAKIERQQKDLDRHPLDLHAVIARTWEGHELHLRESGFTTRWRADAPPYPVVGDEDALAQILVNLLSNAEKYSSNGSKDIELHTYRDGDRVCVSVLDRGSGVPAGEERKIFEAFYRAHDSLSSGVQGSGLGLTLARHLASEHGGEIVFEPREGGGSNFTLRLPVVEGGGESGNVEGGRVG